VFERFTDRARRVVVLAQEEARMLNHGYIGTEHLLLGLIQEEEGVAAKALESLGISLEAVRSQVEEIIGQGQAAPTGHIPFTPRAKKVLELSLREALQLGHNYIGTEHILLGLIREGEGVAAQVLQKLGADLNRVRQTVIQLLSGYTGRAEPSVSFESVPPFESAHDLASSLTQIVGRGKAIRLLAERLAEELATALDDPDITAEVVLAGLGPNASHLRSLEDLVSDERDLQSALVEIERRRKQEGDTGGADPDEASDA
jgi:ATP-dependent Clp protease ATP-binding subunit ClpA